MSTALVFGGAFNPPTIAHIELAEFARKQVGADLVIFVPTKNTYIADEQHKEYVFSDEERLNMLETIAASRPWMKVSRFEIESNEQPRTYITLCHLREEGYQCALLMGSDKLPEFEHGWRYMDKITAEFGIVCMKRSTDDVEGMIQKDQYLSSIAPYIRIVETPTETRGVSSTGVRASLSELARQYRMLKTQVPEEILSLLLDSVLEDMN